MDLEVFKKDAWGNPILLQSYLIPSSSSLLQFPTKLPTMLASKPRRPSVRKLPEPIIPDHRSTVDAGSLSPTSPLERDPRSPKGWRKRDSDGIGLGIVAALEITGSGEPLARLIVSNLSCQSIKIAVGTKLEVGSCSKCSSESMASHGSRDDEELRWGETGSYCAPQTGFIGGVSVFREADFLNYCYLCRKRLHGKDIYMYRGEKAFCSMECRYQQIVSDECQEKCASEASLDISASSYCDGRLFFTGITAA